MSNQEMTINKIHMVEVIEKIFDVEKMDYGVILHTELYHDGIITYHMEKDSKKKMGKLETKVNPVEMDAFFTKLYDFVRNAEFDAEPIDDCHHEVRFIYTPLHKEIFEGGTYKGDLSLTGIIETFVEEHTGDIDRVYNILSNR